jgi:hypothetical protein
VKAYARRDGMTCRTDQTLNEKTAPLISQTVNNDGQKKEWRVCWMIKLLRNRKLCCKQQDVTCTI